MCSSVSFTEGKHAVNGGVAVFYNSSSGIIHGGKAFIYSPNCKVVLAEGSTGEIINCF